MLSFWWTSLELANVGMNVQVIASRRNCVEINTRLHKITKFESSPDSIQTGWKLLEDWGLDDSLSKLQDCSYLDMWECLLAKVWTHHCTIPTSVDKKLIIIRDILEI